MAKAIIRSRTYDEGGWAVDVPPNAYEASTFLTDVYPGDTVPTICVDYTDIQVKQAIDALDALAVLYKFFTTHLPNDGDPIRVGISTPNGIYMKTNDVKTLYQSWVTAQKNPALPWFRPNKRMFTEVTTAIQDFYSMPVDMFAKVYTWVNNDGETVEFDSQWVLGSSV